MEEEKKGKLIFLIIIAILAVALIIAGIVLAINANKPKSNVQITSAEDMQNLVNTVYTGLYVPTLKGLFRHWTMQVYLPMFRKYSP